MQQIIFYLFLFSFSISFSQKLEFNPKKNHPYPFETELIVLNGPKIDLTLKTAIETTFLEDKDAFTMKINQLQIKALGLTIDSDDTKSMGYDSTMVKNLLSKPFTFESKEGNITLTGHRHIDNYDEIQEALKEFGKYYNPNYNQFYKSIVLKKGYSWSVTDSISNNFLDSKQKSITFNYTVENISKKEVVLYGKSILKDKNDTIHLAVKYVLDTKTGIPLYTKFIASGKNDSSILMVNKIEDYQAPTMLDEYIAIQPALDYNNYTKYSDLYSPIAYNYKKRTLITDKDKIEKIIEQSLDSMKIHQNEHENSYFITYPFEELTVLDSLLTGIYTKVNTFRFINKNGATVNLKPNSNIKYNGSLLIGPYYANLFKKNPKIEKAEIDLTIYKPIKRETTSLTTNTNNKNYNFTITDSIATISFKEYINIDYESFRFYDKNNEEIIPKWVPNFISEDLIIDNEEELTQKFITQIPGERKILYTMTFIVKNASKMTFDILTNDLKFKYKKTIYSDAL